MTHTHPHDHTHAHFGEIARQTSSRLALALAITLAFVVVEAIAGYAANSLALLSDAGHNLTDVFALCLSWVAIRLSQRPSSARHTYGFHRAGILAALINSLTLILMSLWIFYEAYQRLVSPPEVQPVLLVLVGALALAVNLGTALLIRRGSRAGPQPARCFRAPDGRRLHHRRRNSSRVWSSSSPAGTGWTPWSAS